MILGSFVARGGRAITGTGTISGGKVYGLYIGGAGNITVTCDDDTSLVFTNVAAGTILPVIVKAVTTLTATGVIGFNAAKTGA